jgi:hydroxymethylpyrimidine pyrophosphatase-like HAD family hydrolase
MGRPKKNAELLPEDQRLILYVDLDGTLAYYDHWRGISHIGEPIEPMLAQVKKWVRQGHTIRIFTARAHDPHALPIIREWLLANGLPELVITNIKGQILFDDRARQVIYNSGTIVNNPL